MKQAVLRYAPPPPPTLNGPQQCSGMQQIHPASVIFSENVIKNY